MSSAGLFAQTPNPPAQPPADKTKFMGKISHWLAAYGISGEDFIREKRNDFKAHAYAEVYIEATIDHNAWMFTMLNRVTKAKYAEKQTPFILFGLKFKPKDDNLNSYEISLTLEDGSAVNPQQDNGIVRAASTKYLGGKTYAEPIEAEADLEKAIGEALDGLQAKLGKSLAPNLMVRYQNEVFWKGHEIPILETEGNTVELEAIDKDGKLLKPTEITWTNADPFQSRGVVDMTGIPSKQVSLRKGDETLTVTLTRVNASEDIRELLKILIVELLSTKKQQAADSVALLKQDSIRNAQNIAAQLAALEANNFRMTSGATQVALFTDGPRLMTPRDAGFVEGEGEQNVPRKASFKLLHKRRELRQTIRKKVNVVAFANLVVDQPDRLTALLEELLRNSGRLVAQLALNRNQQGVRDAARNIVADFLNKNIERIAGGAFGFAQPVEPPLQVTLPPPSASIGFRESQYLYINTQLEFAGRDSLVTELTTYLNSLSEKLYVFINYSQDVSTESFLARSPNARPVGLPEGKNFVVLTVVNIPGSVTYQVLNSNGCTSATTETGVKNNVLNCIQSGPSIGGTLLSEEFEVEGYTPMPAPETCEIYLDPSYKPVILPKNAIDKLYVSPSLSSGILSGFTLKDGSSIVRYKSTFDRDGSFLGYCIDGKSDMKFKQKDNCSQVKLSGPMTVEVLIIDETNCVILYKRGEYSFPANSTLETSIDFTKITTGAAVSSTRLTTGKCGLEQRALVAEEWKPSGLDMKLVDSEPFKTLVKQKAQAFATQIEAAIKSYPTAPEKFYGEEFFHFINAPLLPAATKELDFKVFEHKLQFLKKETGIDFFIILDEVDFYFDPDSEKRNEFAKQVFDLTPSLKGKKNAVLVTIPYFRLERPGQIGNQHQYVMPGISYDASLVNANFIRGSTYPNILTMLTSAYRWTPKPHREYISLLHADGSITFHPKNNGARVVGKDCINCVGFFRNKEFDEIKNLDFPAEYLTRGGQLPAEPNPGYPFQLYRYSKEVIEHLEKSRTSPEWIPVTDKIFKEHAIPAYYQTYAVKLAFASSGLSEWWTELKVNFTEGDGPGSEFADLDKACYTFSALVVLDPLVYGVIDVSSIVPVIDNFADVAGLAYSTARLDYENMTNYTIGIAAVGVGTVFVKYGGRIIKAAYKGGIWLIENGTKTVRKLTKFQSLKAPLCTMMKITDELLISDELIAQIDDILANDNFSVNYLNEVTSLSTDAAKIARLEMIVALEGLIKALPEKSITALRADLADVALTKSFIDNPKLVESWKKLDDLVESGDDAFKTFKKDPDFLKKFDDISKDADLNKHVFEGDLKFENGDIRGISGVHSKDAINIPEGYNGSFNQGDIRLKSGTKNPTNPGPDDYYTAKIEVYGKKYDAQGNSIDGWHNKNSTFFPNSWIEEKIQAEMAHGFQNKQFVRSQNNGAEIYHGTMTDGTTIEFAIKNNVIESAYPNLNP